MKMIEVKERTTVLVEQLLQVWESFVKATHLFLSDDEISNIKQYIPQALNNVPVLVVAENELTVNEQNPLAKDFYEHIGFEVYKKQNWTNKKIHIHCCI